MNLPIAFILAFLFALGGTSYFYRVYRRIRNKEILILVLGLASATTLRFTHILNYYFGWGAAPKIAELFLIVWFLIFLGSRGLHRSVTKVLNR